MQYIDDLITRLVYKCDSISPSGGDITVDIDTITVDDTTITVDQTIYI